ncbi:CpaF family protein [Candidatus Dojkabacteria bacterium]|uniref:CpaF family protein n=1 Tax=Candidatus Dojkabacteria bacterium TaxID=2099670 RepID=A0A5C7J3I5_9BACT|nr:MAG: CpaF family protein [Candidatus Dojkabacteria bacterium]
MGYEKYNISEKPEWDKCFNMLLDDRYSEIEVNGPDAWFTKVNGRRERISNIRLGTLDRLYEGIEAGLIPFVHSPWPFKKDSYIYEGPLRYKVEEGTPHEREIRGRCHMVLPPAADYPQITIAKKSTALATLDTIAQNGSMSTEMLAFLRIAVEAELTIAVSGGTGAGKTTILEAIAKNFRYDSRIGVAEDAPELYLSQPNVTYLHSVPWAPGMNPNDVATLSWVVMQFQRMRTDRIIIGETRGAEFADFLVAANSGMDGSITTLHANTPVECLQKMTGFAMKATGSPARIVNGDIAGAVDIIIQLIYTADGKYRTSEICEVTNTLSNDETARITTNSLYKWDRTTDLFEKKGMVSDELRRKLRNKGINVEPLLEQPIGKTDSFHSNSVQLKSMLDTAGVVDRDKPEEAPTKRTI